jgi:predicted transcriptional regulator
MPYSIRTHLAVTGKVPVEFAAKLRQLAESLHVSRHRLIVRALLIGLDTAAAQIQAETAAEATHQPPAAVKE